MIQNTGDIPDFNVSTIVIRDRKEIDSIRRLQSKYLKKNKIKSYGNNTDKDAYTLKEGK